MAAAAPETPENTPGSTADVKTGSTLPSVTATSSQLDTNAQSTPNTAQRLNPGEPSLSDPNMSPVVPSSSTAPSAPESSSTHPTLDPSTASKSTSSPSGPPLGQTSDALGPAVEGQITPSSASSNGKILHINLLLITGARHPYKIDEKYLKSRRIEPRNAQGAFEPRELSGYQLKELIWTDWRSEWEPRPASPSSIRLIILGRMIENKSSLKDFPFNPDGANVVHMTIKPADIIEDEETAGKSSAAKNAVTRTRDPGEVESRCRCVIQ